MTDLAESIDIWTERLLELTDDTVDEDDARALVADIHDAALAAYREGTAQLEAEREE